MHKFCYIFLLIVINAHLYGELPLYRFETEFSKNNVYQGEALRADFVLYSRLNTVEVEVAKFPEFRGFWKKNTVLRQGKIHSPVVMYGTLWKKILIGSYELVPMVDEAEAHIQPMKLVVRTPNATLLEHPAETILLSKNQNALEIRKLPSPPPSVPFAGAVGNFSLRALSSNVSFEENQPALVRLVLEGKGNFQEINDVPLKLGPNINVLSKQARVSGVFPFQSKIFEWTISVGNKSPFTIDSVDFHYFDPTQEKYLKTQTGPLYFEPAQSKEPSAPPTANRVQLDPLEKNWQPYTLWEKSFWLWSIHAFLSLLYITFLVRRGWQQRREKQREDPHYSLLLQKREAKTALDQQDFERFLYLAEKLALQALQQQADIPKAGQPKSLILKQASQKLDKNTIQHAESIFRAHEKLCYSPESASPQNPKALWEALEAVLAA